MSFVKIEDLKWYQKKKYLHLKKLNFTHKVPTKILMKLFLVVYSDKNLQLGQNICKQENNK